MADLLLLGYAVPVVGVGVVASWYVRQGLFYRRGKC